jgi:chromosome segregation ATPase
MTWTCPHCGYTNKMDPLNSRHKPLCGGCNEPFETPDRLQKEKDTEIKRVKEDLTCCQLAQNAIKERIGVLKTELSEEQIKLDAARSEYSDLTKDLKKWENVKVHGIDQEPDKAAKAALDIHQVKLPFEVMA